MTLTNSGDQKSPSPKICPTCKREKCREPECLGPLSNPDKCHCQGECFIQEVLDAGTKVQYAGHPPAEKEADEMRVAMSVLKKSVVIQGNLEKLIVDVDLQKNMALALHEAKAQGRREMKDKIMPITKCGLDSDDCGHAECNATEERECLFYRRAMNDVAHALDTIKD